MRIMQDNPNDLFFGQASFEVHPNSIMVDVSGRDITHFDNVDAALGLTRPDDSSYESICDEVKPIDVARDAVGLWMYWRKLWQKSTLPWPLMKKAKRRRKWRR
jgi:hypothetical protein